MGSPLLGRPFRRIVNINWPRGVFSLHAIIFYLPIPLPPGPPWPWSTDSFYELVNGTIDDWNTLDGALNAKIADYVALGYRNVGTLEYGPTNGAFPTYADAIDISEHVLSDPNAGNPGTFAFFEDSGAPTVPLVGVASYLSFT